MVGQWTGTGVELTAKTAISQAAAGCDVLVISKGLDAYEEAIAAVSESHAADDAAIAGRIDALRFRCLAAPRPGFDRHAWERLAEEVTTFTEMLDKPRPKVVVPDYLDE